MKDLTTSQKWIEAGIVLGKDPGAKVACPVCDHKFLRAFDVTAQEQRHLSRYIVCDNCGAHNILSMKIDSKF